MGVWSEKWVAVASRLPESAEPFAAAVRSEGGQCLLLTERPTKSAVFSQVVRFNPARPETLAAGLEKHRQKSVHLHGAVNLVHAPQSPTFLSLSPGEFDAALGQELRFLRCVLHGELGRMLNAGGGAITTVLGYDGAPWHEPGSLHAAITGAAEGLTQAVAEEYGRVKIRANCVWVGTRSENEATELPEPVARPDARRSSPRWSLVREEEIVGAALGLLLPGQEAVTGQTLRLG